LIEIARAAGSDPGDEPWAGLRAIQGKREFFNHLFQLLEKSKVIPLDDALIQGMLDIVFNSDDKIFLQRLLNR
jgi:hypothetical protein